MDEWRAALIQIFAYERRCGAGLGRGGDREELLLRWGPAATTHAYVVAQRQMHVSRCALWNGLTPYLGRTEPSPTFMTQAVAAVAAH